METINAGLIGFGTVGTGVYRVLTENADVIEKKLGCRLRLKKIADRDVERDRGVKVDPALLTADPSEVINDPGISIVIELIGGTGAAREFIVEALAKGKHVVTANKALLSTHGREIFETARSMGLDIGFEASVGGGIPVIKALREGLAANHVESICGIINGTANYILSRMTSDGGRFEDVLAEAQARGYAEADPTYDVEGIDTAHKLAILINIAYGTYVELDSIYTEGISRITPLDIAFAAEFGYRVKLLAIAKSEDGEIEARVHPTMIPATHPLASVDGAFNAVHIEGDAVGPVMLYGLGAGMMPTASAVVADVVDIARNMRNGVGRRLEPLSYMHGAVREAAVRPMDELDIPWYLRFSALDRPGVLSRIAGVLGAHNISISSVIQKGRQAGEAVPLVILTHHAKERQMRAALAEIETLDVVRDRPAYIRIEENLGASR
ncbi:MAG TPA: homoserine dehydrogenase [Deltaproteobacteria bacterium]|nr:homoserine dehydrogenase [Deltaproteobacteria bacterium]